MAFVVAVGTLLVPAAAVAVVVDVDVDVVDGVLVPVLAVVACCCACAACCRHRPVGPGCVTGGGRL